MTDSPALVGKLKGVVVLVCYVEGVAIISIFTTVSSGVIAMEMAGA